MPACSGTAPAPPAGRLAALGLHQPGAHRAQRRAHHRIAEHGALRFEGHDGGLGLLLLGGPLRTGSQRCSARIAETLLDSTLQMVRNIPALALIPLVILWFGVDETDQLFLVAPGVFFPLYLNTFYGIGKAYGQRQVLRDIDLNIAIVGCSGCGKSTLNRRAHWPR